MFFIHVSLKMGNKKKTGFEIVAKALRAAYSVLNEFYLKLKNVLMLLTGASFSTFCIWSQRYFDGGHRCKT